MGTHTSPNLTISRGNFSTRYSMGTQIGAAMAVIILICAIPAFFFSAWRQKISGTELMLNQAASIGQMVAAASSDGITFSNAQLLSRAARGVESLRDFEWIIIRNTNGDTVYTSQFQHAPEALRNGAQIMPLDSVRTILDDNGDVIVAAPVRMLVGNERIGEVLIGLKPTVLNANIARSRFTSIIGGTVIAGICLLVAILFAQWLTKPLRKLYKLTQSVAEGDLKQRAPLVKGFMAKNEAGVLTYAFNRVYITQKEKV